MSNWIISTRKKVKEPSTHHLWSNHGVWNIVLTLHNKATGKTIRHRQTLKTSNLALAIRRRDKILHQLYTTYGREEF